VKRFVSLLYGLLSYVLSQVTIVYAIGFLGDFLVPKTVNSGPVPDVWYAILLDAALLGLFAVQHSVMARPGFKRAWKRIVPEHLERSTYVLISALLLVLIYVFWQPIPTVLWDAAGTWMAPVLWAIFGAGWLLLVAGTHQIDHYALFGVKQVWMHYRGETYTPPEFQVTGLYRYVRHPIMTGFLLAFWAIPTMTVGHALFAGLATGYIFVGTFFEERDLLDRFGEQYARYRKSTPMLLPGIGSSEEP